MVVENFLIVFSVHLLKNGGVLRQVGRGNFLNKIVWRSENLLDSVFVHFAQTNAVYMQKIIKNIDISVFMWYNIIGYICLHKMR